MSSATPADLPPVEPSSEQITVSETDRSRLQTFIHSGHASTRVRTNPKKRSPVANGDVA